MKNWFKKNKKAEVPSPVFSDQDVAGFLKEILHEKGKELIYNRVQIWIWTQEAVSPVKIGKRQAEDTLALYQKRNRELEGQILTFKTYAEENNILLI